MQRSTLNFQRGDRKGAWWPGYGDRHDVWGLAAQIEGQTRYLGDRAFDPPDLLKGRSGGPSRLWRPDMGTDTEFGRPDF